MDFKKVLIWISILTVVVGGILTAGVGLYYYKPHWLGVKTPRADSLARIEHEEKIKKDKALQKKQLLQDSARKNPLPLRELQLDTFVEVSSLQLSTFESSIKEKNKLLDSLYKREKELQDYSNILNDSLKNLNKKIIYFGDSIKAAKSNEKNIRDSLLAFHRKQNEITETSKKLSDSLKINKENYTKISDELKNIQKNYNKSKEDYKRIQEDLTKSQKETKEANAKLAIKEKELKELQDKYEKKKDSLITENYKVFAGIYNKAKPAEVAKIMQDLTSEQAAAILKRMQKKKAGKVIESMDPIKAAEVLKYSVTFD